MPEVAISQQQPTRLVAVPSTQPTAPEYDDNDSAIYGIGIKPHTDDNGRTEVVVTWHDDQGNMQRRVLTSSDEFRGQRLVVDINDAGYPVVEVIVSSDGRLDVTRKTYYLTRKTVEIATPP